MIVKNELLRELKSKMNLNAQKTIKPEDMLQVERFSEGFVQKLKTKLEALLGKMTNNTKGMEYLMRSITERAWKEAQDEAVLSVFSPKDRCSLIEEFQDNMGLNVLKRELIGYLTPEIMPLLFDFTRSPVVFKPIIPQDQAQNQADQADQGKDPIKYGI